MSGTPSEDPGKLITQGQKSGVKGPQGKQELLLPEMPSGGAILQTFHKYANLGQDSDITSSRRQGECENCWILNMPLILRNSCFMQRLLEFLS